MSSVVGIDLSSKALDLVKLDEDSDSAEWQRVELEGKDAWERTLNIKHTMRNDCGHWWPDVYLVAIEAPYGTGQPGTNAILNRVVGAVAASLPARLRAPERCWIVRPDEWRAGLGLKAKPGDDWWRDNAPQPRGKSAYWTQDARDAYCIALFARNMIQEAA